MSNLSHDEILEKVCTLAANQAAITRAEVGRESNFVQDLNFDSLDQVEFIMEVEDEFGINVPDGDAEKVKRIRDAVDLILRFTNEAQQPA